MAGRCRRTAVPGGSRSPGWGLALVTCRLVPAMFTPYSHLSPRYAQEGDPSQQPFFCLGIGDPRGLRPDHRRHGLAWAQFRMCFGNGMSGCPAMSISIPVGPTLVTDAGSRLAWPMKRATNTEAGRR